MPRGGPPNTGPLRAARSQGVGAARRLYILTMATLSDTETLVDGGGALHKGVVRPGVDSMASRDGSESEAGAFFAGRSHPQTSFVETG